MLNLTIDKTKLQCYFVHTAPQQKSPSSILKTRGDIMKHVDNSGLQDVLFMDIPSNVNVCHKSNDNKIFTENIRINLGLYRTPVETERYISESLKRKLP